MRRSRDRSRGSGRGGSLHGARRLWPDGEKLGPSLREALTHVKGRLALWEQYMVALRTVELLTRRGKSHVGMTLKGANAIIDETKARPDFQNFERAKETYWQFKDAILEYMVRQGAITPAQKRFMQRLHQAYIPFSVMDEVEGIPSSRAVQAARGDSPIASIRSVRRSARVCARSCRRWSPSPRTRMRSWTSR
jgi:hypothetical protein